jgi:plastocyanin
MAHPSSQTTALLYSAQSRDLSLVHLVDQIRGDPILSKGIRLISVDNPYVKNLLQGNESGVTVKKWPVFAVKTTTDQVPTLYPLDSYEKVFELVRSKSPRVVSELSRSSSTKESIEEKPAPVHRRVHFAVRSPPEKKLAPPEKKFAPPSRLVNWDSEVFSEGPISMIVSEGTSLRFVSEDNLVHDVTLADSKWQPIRRLIPRQKQMNQELLIGGQLLKTIERGRCYLVSSLPQDRKMRLVLRLLDPIDEIINGMSEVDSSERKGETRSPPERGFAPPRTWKFIRDEPDDWSSSPEKSGPPVLRTNSLIARIRVPQIDESPLMDDPAPVKATARTTFAQRLLAKLQ